MPYNSLAAVAVSVLVVLYAASGTYDLRERLIVVGLFLASFLVTGYPLASFLCRVGVGIYLCIRMGIHTQERRIT